MNAGYQKPLTTSARQESAKPRRAARATLRLRRILVPLDFSGQSRQALAFAVPLAAQYGGRIILVHIVEPSPVYTPYPGEAGLVRVDTRSIEESSEETLTQMAGALVPPELLGKTIVRTGRAYAEIIAAAEELDVDLIVMATHGYTGLKHVLLGSTTEHVVRHAHCPVLTVRRH